MTLIDCVYASPSVGVHDRRWIAALRSIGREPTVVSRSDFASDELFVTAVHLAAQGTLPVLAGPLPLADLLLRAGEKVAFLSWGFDLHAADAPLSSLPLFTSVITDSAATTEIARRSGAARVIELPWGIELDLFTDDGAVFDLSAFGVGAGEHVVLSLRAHEDIYRVGDVIDACAALPAGVRLVVGHSGSQTGALRAKATEQGVDAVFIPTVDESDLASLLRRSSVYVTASEVDGTSVTLLQAMACGTPVVASMNAGNIDWVRDQETGYTFAVGDIQGMQAAILSALSRDADVTQGAQQRVRERANWSENIERLRQAFD